MDSCLSEEVVIDLLDGVLPPEAVTALHAHVDSCPGCRTLLAWTVPREEDEPAPIQPGAQLDRYQLLEAIGIGASGVVYAAFDPKLGRKVAIKLLRADATRAADLRRRLMREATALAQLQHPHVVAVHDTGEVPEGVFLAMELVEGSTLTAWLGSAPRKPQKIVQVFLQAGAGLQAAHEAGLVHRDFKPDNVLVGANGRVRVTDFGLARETGEEGAAPAAMEVGRVTRTGALVGTPAYMAPEQLAGGPADARSDQFSFCVALYEALYGRRPFAGRTLEELRASLAERAPPLPRRAGVSRRLRRALLRGLRSDPAGRFESVAALLRELEPAAARWPFLAAGAAVAALALATGLFARNPCSGAEAAWGEVWNPAQQARARAALAAAQPGSAEQLFQAANAAFERYRLAWTAMRLDACKASRERGEQSETLLDRRMQCLSERRTSAAVLARLIGEDGNAPGLAANVVSSLPPLELCANAGALLAKVPLPADPVKRARAAQLAERLAEADVLSNAGQMDKALAIANEIGSEAEKLGDASLISRALRLQGYAGYKPAAEREAILTRAAAAGIDGRDDEASVDAWTRLAYEVGVVQLRTREGLNYATIARAALRRLGEDHGRTALLAVFEADLAWAQHEPERARSLLEEARRNFVAVGGESYWRLGIVEERLGNWDLASCHGAEALQHHEAAERLRTGAGLRAATRITSLINQAEALLRLSRPQDAVPRLAQAAELAKQREPGRNWYLHAAQGWAARDLGRLADALALDTDAAAVCAAHEAKDAPGCGLPLRGVGLDLLLLGRVAEAAPRLERALQLSEASPDVMDRIDARFALARGLRAARLDPVRAGRLAREARDEVAALAAQNGGYCTALQAEMDRWLAE